MESPDTKAGIDLKFDMNGTDNHLKINFQNTRKASLILRVLNNKLRQEILKIISTEKKANVTQLYSKLGIEQSLTSQHLALLRKARVVITERQGKCIYYSINNARVEDIGRFVTGLLS